MTDSLPTGPMLAVIALLIVWSGLFTAIDAAQQHLLTLRGNSRNGDKSQARLAFPKESLILCNTLCRVLAVIISTLLALFYWAENGPWLACLISTCALLVLAEYLPRALAVRYPEGTLGFGNSLLLIPMKIVYPLAWLLDTLSQLLLRPFARKASAVKHSDDDPCLLYTSPSPRDS